MNKKSKKPVVVSIANHKGGVGKTTTASSLGSILSKQGYKVLLVDLDAQANLTTSLSKAIDGPSVYDAMTGRTSTLPIVVISDTLHLVPASLALAMVDVELSTAIARETILSGLIDRACETEKYDIVLLDCPPSLGLMTLNAFTASNGIIIPLVSEVLPFKGLTMINDFVTMVSRRLNPDLRIIGILLTRWEGSKLSRSIEQKLRETLGDEIFQTKIRKNIRLAEAPLESRGILDYDSGCNGAKDYMAFAAEFLSRINQQQ